MGGWKQKSGWIQIPPASCVPFTFPFLSQSQPSVCLIVSRVRAYLTTDQHFWICGNKNVGKDILLAKIILNVCFWSSNPGDCATVLDVFCLRRRIPVLCQKLCVCPFPVQVFSVVFALVRCLAVRCNSC